MKVRILAVATLAALSLTACSNSSSDNATSDDTSYSTTSLDSLGNSICGAIGRGMSHAQAREVLQSATPNMTNGQADDIIRTAINAYCPEYAGRW